MGSPRVRGVWAHPNAGAGERLRLHPAVAGAIVAEQSPAISDDELAALQARFESLHAAQLLTDEELYASEDLCADFVELQASVLDGGVLTMDAIFRAVRHTPAALQVYKLVRLSGSMASDAAFARQLRRKFL